LRCRSVKDGCSPQGQCGCCTVWVDGAARVACVTPVRRIAGRSVTTVEGLSPGLETRWVDAFLAAGASQCGFCTPGILMRLAALENGNRPLTRRAVESALLAHLCRCTGWQSIVEAGCAALGVPDPDGAGATRVEAPVPDQLLSEWRAQIEGTTSQVSGPDVVLGGGGFADDGAPATCVLQLGATNDVATGELSASPPPPTKVQGRNSTMPLVYPVALPEASGGEWALTLQTTWVEPAYVEPDASWCLPGGEPATPLANGGAFGGKRRSPVARRAHSLATEMQDRVRVLWSREDVVRFGPKRPPLALGLRADGSGVVRIGRTPDSPDLGHLRDRVAFLAPALTLEEVDIVGPPVGDELRGAGWVEVLAALTVLRAHNEAGTGHVAQQPGTGRASLRVAGGGRAQVDVDLTGGPNGRGIVNVEVWAGEILDPVTLRSYTLGAVHQALGLVWSEGIAVDTTGGPLDLTIRSFGILAARDMPHIEVVLHPEDRWPVNGSDAVFAATAAAAWMAEGAPPRWPTRRGGAVKRNTASAPAGQKEEVR
jgi:xanthine dehydrogenase small subunit